MIDTNYFADTDMVTLPKVGIPKDEEPRKNPDGKIEKHWKSKDPHKYYDKIDPEACGSLDSQQYMICDYNLSAFVLQKRHVGMCSCNSRNFDISF